MDLSRLKYPRLFAFLIGVPSGIVIAFKTVDAPPPIPHLHWGHLGHLLLFVCFGFFLPVALFAMQAFARQPRTILDEYLNVPRYIFWGGVSCLIVGVWLLRREPLGNAHIVCAFFASGGVGFLCADAASTLLQRDEPE